MAELTPEERQRIYEEEKARLEAHTRNESEQKNKPRYGCLMIIGLLVVLIAVFLAIDTFSRKSSSSTPSKQISRQVKAITTEDETMLKEMLDSKLIEKIDPSLNQAWVNPVTWATMKYENKKQLGWFLAQYCGKKKGTGLIWVEIFDVYSGKKLAKYSESLGFKVF